MLDKYSIIEANRTRTVYNWLQYFRREEIEKEFNLCGSKIETMYNDVAGTPFTPETKEIAVVASKI